MTYTMTVDRITRRVFVRAQGPITAHDILTHIEEERLEGGLPYRELIDARGYIPVFAYSDVREIVSALRRLGASSRLGPTAIVVDSDLGFGMVRMVEMMVDDVCVIRAFRQVGEAEEWLAEVGEGQS